MNFISPILKIEMSALKHNLDHYVKALKQNTRLMMMVKGSAYGLGSLEITRWAQATGLISDLAVAYVSEGIELRCSKQISLPIMVIIVTASEFDTCRQFNLEPVIYSIDMLDELLKFLQKLQGENKITFVFFFVIIECNFFRPSRSSSISSHSY